MKRPTLTTAAVILIALCSIARAADDTANKADLARMQGEWKMVSGSRGGEDMPEAMLSTGKRVCKDDQVTVNVGGMLVMKATVTLDASKSPKTIDYAVTDGPAKGKKQLGIYEFDGETLKFCFAQPDAARPDSFESKAGDARTTSAWKKAEEKKTE